MTAETRGNVGKGSIVSVAIAEHRSPIGTLWSTWTQHGLFSLSWNEPTPIPTLTSNEHAVRGQAKNLDQLLDVYFRTGTVCFDEVVIDPTGWSDFAANVYRCCRAIESGTTVTYKRLAMRVGNERASRAVGAAMSRNRVLLVIPCHRVLSGQGELRGFSARGGLTTKRQLLDLERKGCWSEDLFSGEGSLPASGSS